MGCNFVTFAGVNSNGLSIKNVWVDHGTKHLLIS